VEVIYFIRGESFSIKSTWFSLTCISRSHEVDLLIKDCALDFYENHSSESNAFPAEISVCLENKEIGRRRVALFFEPVFEII
jgi:hypothetical protein